MMPIHACLVPKKWKHKTGVKTREQVGPREKTTTASTIFAYTTGLRASSHLGLHSIRHLSCFFVSRRNAFSPYPFLAANQHIPQNRFRLLAEYFLCFSFCHCQPSPLLPSVNPFCGISEQLFPIQRAVKTLI